ncbi:MAG TPA: FAD:protein FMN transferase [Candidatus Hydrogenedentes bacterium]|nr:FAD:protein FMN transferase [Candidatus Hydrogenedentota bacterium]HQM47275.1 FAD:protein FMN transferase [Candidatus Hydrogenedentota bacterium]
MRQRFGYLGARIGLLPAILGCVAGLAACSPEASGPEPANPSASATPPTETAAGPESLETSAAAAGASGERLQQTMRYQAMGTDFEFTLYTGPGAESTAEIVRIADLAIASVRDLEEQISQWKPQSQTTYINRHAAEEPVRVSPEVFDLLQTCKTVYAETGGAFDVTVGPLVELWGFYKGEGHLPSDEELRGAVARVGLEKVTLNEGERTVAFSEKGMHLDFGGIGKGLALEVAAEVIRSYGVSSGILHGGTSSVLAIGAPPGEPGWTVRIRNPYNTNKYIDEVCLKDESLSTSASYEKWFELEGKKYCHIFDPRTGLPVEGMVSATAIVPSGTLSDALSTAFFVMGVEKTREYCREHPGVRAILVPHTGGELEPRRIGFDAP